VKRTRRSGFRDDNNVNAQRSAATPNEVNPLLMISLQEQNEIIKASHRIRFWTFSVGIRY
jgi:hypothetical protein